MVVLPPDIVIFIKMTIVLHSYFHNKGFLARWYQIRYIFKHFKKMLPWYQTSFTKVYSEDISYPKNINIHSRINNINIHRNVNISSEI